MGRPMKPTGELSRYMKNKLEAGGELGEGQPGIKHRVTTKKHTSSEVAAARIRKEAEPIVDPFIKKMRLLYSTQLESGVDGVTSKCHYQGLTGLAQSYHAPHPEIKKLLTSRYDTLTRVEKDVIAAYGYEVLMGNV